MKRAFEKLKEARNMNAVMLHHDAITGTHGSSVQQDYKRILGDVKRAMDDAGVIMNVSESFTGTYDVVLFNPSAYIREEIVSMTVNSDKIVASSDQPTQFELHPQMTMNPQGDQQNTQKFTLYFKVTLGALQVRKLKVQEVSQCQQNCVFLVV